MIDSLSESRISKEVEQPVFHYKGRTGDPKKIGRELGVHALLSGTVVQTGDDLSVSVELIDVRDDSHIWGERYGRKVSEVVALPQQISRDVSQRLRSRADNMDHAQLTRNYSPDSEAYRLYLQGRYNWNKRTVEGLQKGIEYFGHAIHRDQDYGLAYAGLADCYVLLNVYNVVSGDFSQAGSRVEKGARDHESWQRPYFARLCYLRYRLQWTEAEEHFRKHRAESNLCDCTSMVASYLAALEVE